MSAYAEAEANEFHDRFNGKHARERHVEVL